MYIGQEKASLELVSRPIRHTLKHGHVKLHTLRCNCHTAESIGSITPFFLAMYLFRNMTDAAGNFSLTISCNHPILDFS